MSTWIQTYTGKKFFPLAPVAADICIEDIAHALSNVCRFTGHCREFYSVAQHSVIVAWNVPAEFALHALLHDAAEAYIADLARPVKRGIAEYAAIEKRLERAVAERFELDPAGFAAVKHADLRALATERRDLMGPAPAAWIDIERVEPFGELIKPCAPSAAERMYLAMWDIHARGAHRRSPVRQAEGHQQSLSRLGGSQGTGAGDRLDGLRPSGEIPSTQEVANAEALYERLRAIREDVELDDARDQHEAQVEAIVEAMRTGGGA